MLLFDMALHYRSKMNAQFQRFYRLDLVRSKFFHLPVMCISRIRGDVVTCWWIDELGVFNSKIFDPSEIYRVACWNWQKTAVIDYDLDPRMNGINEI